MTEGAAHWRAGVRKPPREETAGSDTWAVRHTRYGDLIGAGDAREGRRDGLAHWPAAMRLVSKRLLASDDEGFCSI